MVQPRIHNPAVPDTLDMPDTLAAPEMVGSLHSSRSQDMPALPAEKAWHFDLAPAPAVPADTESLALLAAEVAD